MASQVPPKKGVAYTFEIGLVSQANGATFQSNPTLAAGDVKVRTDGGSLSNMATLPTASGKIVTGVLDTSEMNGDRIVVQFSDVVGAEWADKMFTIHTSANLLDDVASSLTTLLNRIGAFTGSGVNTILGFFKALLSKAASTPSDVGGTFDASADSTEAIKDAIGTPSDLGSGATVGDNLSDLSDRTLSEAEKDRLAEMLEFEVTVDDSTDSPSNTAFETTLTVDEDRFTNPNQVGRWRSGAANDGESFEITGYEYTVNNKVKLTISSQRAVPVDGDKFVIVGAVFE